MAQLVADLIGEVCLETFRNSSEPCDPSPELLYPETISLCTFSGTAGTFARFRWLKGGFTGARSLPKFDSCMGASTAPELPCLRPGKVVLRS
jgi:hypothetical protein